MRAAALILVCATVGSAQPYEQLIARAREVARTGDADSAEKLLLKATAAAPSAAEPWLLRGNLATFLRKQPEEGVALYRASLKLEDRWDAHYFLGQALVQLGHQSDGAEEFEAAAALQPNSTAPLAQAAGAWAAAGSWDRAEEAVRMAAAKDSYDTAPMETLARAAAKLGAAPAQVLRYWRDAIDANPWQAPKLLDFAAVLLKSRGGSASSADGSAAETAAAPTVCDLVDAATLLSPGLQIPPPLSGACGDSASEAASKSTAADAAQTAAATALRGGACAIVASAPQLAPYAAVADDGISCDVSLPSTFAAALSLGPHGLLIRHGQRLNIVGPEAEGLRPTLDAAGGSRHFLVAGGQLSLRGVALRNGRALLSGGGAILLLGGSVELADVELSANRAVFGSGGAIAARCAAGCKLLLDNVHISDNAATWRAGALSIFGRAEAPGDGDGSAAAVAKVDLSLCSFGSNTAGRAVPDVHACGADVGGADVVFCNSADAGDNTAFTANALEALEAQADAMEVLELRGLGRHALGLLQRASLAAQASPAAFAAHFTFLYTRGMDAQAAARLGAYQLARPADPALPGYHAMLQNQTAPALLERARTLNSEIELMREGGPSATLYTSRFDAQDAATAAFLKAVTLAPDDGDAWLDFGTSLYFAGEHAESARVYARGLELNPSHAGLRAEAEKAAAFPPAPVESDDLVATFGDDAFRTVAIPPGSYGDRPDARDIQVGAEVFGESPNVYITRTPMLSAEECATAIRLANEWADANGGWTTSRHYAVATTDVPLVSLPAALPWFNEALAQRLLPALASRFPQAAPRPSKLRVIDCFLVRYRAGEQHYLPVHTDQSPLSFTIALNDPTEYEGGGTEFPTLGLALDAPRAGHAILFPGKLLHGAASISSGTRYVIVLFMGYDTNRSGRREGYVLEQNGRGSGSAAASEGTGVGAVKEEL